MPRKLGLTETVPKSCYTQKAGMVAKNVPWKLVWPKLSLEAGLVAKDMPWHGPSRKLGAIGCRKLGCAWTPLESWGCGCPRKLPSQVVKAGFIYMLFTSRVSGRGYRNGAVCVCVCVCVCFCYHSHSRTIWHMVTEFGTGIDIDNISDECAGQGQRSRSWRPKTSFSGFSDLNEQISSLGLWCNVMTSHDVMGSCRDVMWRHCMTSHNAEGAATLQCFFFTL